MFYKKGLTNIHHIFDSQYFSNPKIEKELIMPKYSDDKVTEGTITEEQWKKILKWAFEGKSILFELIKEYEKDKK